MSDQSTLSPRSRQRSSNCFSSSAVSLSHSSMKLRREIGSWSAAFAARALAALERRHEAGHVGEGRVAAHAVVVLHATLGGQAVVVPAHRVEEVLAAHALVARGEVHVGVAEDVADVQAARRGGRRSVDAEDRVLAGREGGGPIEPVGALLPRRSPTWLPALRGRAVTRGWQTSSLVLRFAMCGTASVVRCLNVTPAAYPGGSQRSRSADGGAVVPRTISSVGSTTDADLRRLRREDR